MSTTRNRSSKRRANLAPGLTVAQQELAAAHVPLARKLAAPLKRAWPNDAEEYESEALLALVEAAGKYDPSMPVKFATYARHRILGALKDLHRRKAKAAARDAERIVANPEAVSTPQRLDEDEAFDRRIEPLNLRQKAIFRLIYRLGKSQAEAAAILGLSQTTVSEAHREGLERLREHALAALIP